MRREASLTPSWHWPPEPAQTGHRFHTPTPSWPRAPAASAVSSCPSWQKACLCLKPKPHSTHCQCRKASLEGSANRLKHESQRTTLTQKPQAFWDSWNQFALGRKCNLPTKAAFLCRGAGVHGGQVCGSWGAWGGKCAGVGVKRWPEEGAVSA